MFAYRPPAAAGCIVLLLQLLTGWCHGADPAHTRTDVLRAAIPRASEKPDLDGKLDDPCYRTALCTPVEYFHTDFKNRAGQFFYLWDDDAFYVGLRTLDARPYSQENPLWEGDAVEWYFDVRRGADFLSRHWPKSPHAGAVHCFFTAMHLGKVGPRFTLRPGFEQAITSDGVEVAASRTPHGLEVEFKLPWSNFPDFTPRSAEVIGIDAELSYSDGGTRSYRTFVFGSPLSVWQPANLARVILVDRIDREHWPQCGPVVTPIRVDVPWNQEDEPHAVARVAMPPGALGEQIGNVMFHVSDLTGKSLGQFAADTEVVLEADGGFKLLEARWPASLAAPGRFQVHAIVLDSHGKELARIAPRLTSVNMEPGY